MSWIVWVRLVMELLPLVIQGMQVVEAIFGAGRGEMKKGVVLGALAAAIKAKPNSEEDVVAIFDSQIDATVAKLNAAGVFSKS